MLCARARDRALKVALCSEEEIVCRLRLDEHQASGKWQPMLHRIGDGHEET
jgi:hypothetical protein